MPVTPCGHLARSEKGYRCSGFRSLRNKFAITCNLRDPDGQEVIRDLVRVGYDIVVENFRPGTLERWNLGYESLKAVNNGLIMARISGYGQEGPARSRPGFGRIAQAFGGLTYLCGFPDRAPANPGSATIADYVSGLFAAYGVLTAERHRAATGTGQLIDIALFESVFRVLDSLAITYSVTGKVRERMGTATALAAPHNHYPTRDGKWVAIACTNDRIFARLAAVMEQGELTADPRFLRERERVANRADIDRIVEAWTRSHDLAPLISALNQAEIPCSPINSIADIFQDQQFAARAALTAFQHPILGEIKMPSIVPRLSETPGAIEWLGRGLGEDTSSVLGRALNYSAERLAELRSRGVI